MHQTIHNNVIVFIIIIIRSMKPTVYLKTGDLITISHEGLFLAIQSLTQSIPTMRQSISNSLNSVFVLTTHKYLQKSLQEQKPLTAYDEDDIYYSEPVLLYHFLSGKFLSYNKDIENKASVQLVSSFKENCKFSIKPIFKCQTVITRKIRNQESVLITPAEAYNLEGNVAMIVLRNDSRKGDDSYILMKKNESSKFELARKNQVSISSKSLTNIYVYQLLNIQTRKHLYMTQSQNKNKDLVTFQKNINEFGTYFDIRLKNSEFGAIGVRQQEINYGIPFYFHSWKEDKYLSINIIGDVCLTEIPNEEAQFTIQSYSDLELNRDSVVRIKHVPSQKYLSLNAQGSEIQVTHQARLIDTFMLIRVPIEELRLNVFINNAHEIIQRELSGKKISYSNRQKIFKVLKQLINFIYGDQITISDFLSMRTKISCKLSSNDQKLLANIGIITTLVRMCRAFIEEITKQPESKQFEQRDNTDEQIIIIYTMMSIVGICNRNAASMRILVQEMPLLYQSLVSVSGIIQSFYNLLKDSKELLLVIENTSHKIGRKQVPSMQVLISMLSGHQIDIPTKCKILKLLEVFIVVNHKEKILGHEAILLKSLMEGKLDNVMLPMKSNDHEQLYIYLPQKKAYQELQEVVNSRRAYEKQLELVKTQIQLLCSLCVNSNSQCFNYANKIITEEILLRYLKSNLQPDFKQIFMRVLIDVYLSNLALKNNSMPKSFIICQKDGERRHGFSKIESSSIRQNLLTQGQQMSDISSSPSHSKMIENIQNYILEITKKSIINEIIDSSFYMNLKSLRKFLDLRILDQEEVVEFRLLLIQYIAKFSKVSFKEEEKKKIVLEVIKIMTDYFNQHLEFVSEELILVLRAQKIPQQKLHARFLQFISKYSFFDSEIQQVQLSFLPKLIKESIEFNSLQIFVAASSLFKLINERLSVFFYRLRQKIIIDSDWSYKFYTKIQKLKRSLSQQIQAYMISKGDQKQIQYVEQQLNQLVKQLNFCFFQSSNNNSSQLSQLTQNIYRQMNLLEMIVNFLNQSQDKFKDGIKGNVDIYATCFEFIGLYLQNNRENFKRFQDKYMDIKFVFQHQDRGQIKFLNYLIKMPSARDLMIDQIIECIIMSFQHNAQPNPYTLLTLINAISNPHIDKQRIQHFVQKLLSSPKLFQSILKVSQIKNSYTLNWSHDPKSPNYHAQWPIYAYLLMKLLLILLEQSTQRTSLSYEIQKYLNINSLIELLKIQDLLTSTSMLCLEGTLLKVYIIKLFLKIYIPALQKEVHQIQNISSFVHLTLQSLAYVKEELEGTSTQLFEQVANKSSDHGEIIFEAQIKTKTRISIKQFDKYFNPLYTSIVQYLPFIIKLLQKLLNSNSYIESNPSKKSELGLYMDNIYRKMRDMVQYKLTYKQLIKYSKQYNSAINNSEDIFKKKLGLNIQVEDDGEEEDIGEVDSHQYFINVKIQNTVQCYRYASGDRERRVYEMLLAMFHSSQFYLYFRQHQQSFPIQLTFQEMEKVKQMMLKYINLNNQKFTSTVRLFNFFARFNMQHCLKMSFSKTRQQLLGYLGNQRQDSSNDKLCSYLLSSSHIFKQQIEKQQITVKKTQAFFPFKQDFIQRIRKRIEVQKMLYTSHKIYEQAGIYTESKLLVFEQAPTSFNIELCLEWIRNMTVITPFQLKQKLNSAFFVDVVDLLKVYTTFIREFNCKYVTYQIYNKINLCLSIIFHFISGLTERSLLINYLIERQIWNDLNLILSLDDSITKNLEEINDSQSETFKKVSRSQQKTNPRIFLKQAEKLYQNSKKNYKNLIPDSYYPLLPMKCLFGELKQNVISILKQFKNFSLEISKQLFSRIDISLINRNIFDIYRKHHRLFIEYDIPSLQIDIQYEDKNQMRQIADNFIFQNGVDLASIKMYVSTISGSNDIKTQYNNLRIQALTTKKIQSAFSSLWNLIKDFFLLFISCFLSLCRKTSSRYKRQQQEIDEKRMLSILNFFLTKTGRVQILFNKKQLLSIDFVIRPECFVNKQTKEKFIGKINFVSMQLKLQSIYRQARVFLLRFQNQIDFYRRFSKLAYFTFLTRNIEMLTYLNFAVIVAQNIVLIINSDSKQQYFTTNTFDQPFVWLQVASTVIAGSVLAGYLIKDFNLLIKNINMKLKIRAASYGSNYNSYNMLIKFWIKFTMVIMDPSFAYRLTFTLIICLVFYNKLFAALLMLDIFFQIPTLKNLLMSVWRPKIQLILALVSFVLLQYFFSIFMFFNFKNQTLGFCKTLGSCFGFVFVTTYKAVGGFVGYLFVKNGSQIQPVNFFQIFQDIYVVLIFQIFFGLILAIIIDTFSLIRTEQTARKDYLNGCCIVCNLDKAKFNSSTMSFKAHIAITHNIWNYFYYYEYIHHKPALKRTAFEREIFLLKSATWLPIDESFDVAEQKLAIQVQDKIRIK